MKRQSTEPRASISIVIPCHNAAATLPDQLAALTPQVTELVEILVVDNASTDDLYEAVAHSSSVLGLEVRIVKAPDRLGVNYARNVGCEASQGDYILLCDADDEVHPGWLRAMAEPMMEGADCVGGNLMLSSSGNWLQPAQRGLPIAHGVDMPYAFGANCGFTRRVFEALGGFDEAFVGGFDEVDYFCRAQDSGFRLVHVPASWVTYRLRDSRRSVFAQYRGYGRGHARLLAKRGKTLGLMRSLAYSILALPSVFLFFIPHRKDRRRDLQQFAYRIGILEHSLKALCPGPPPIPPKQA